MKPKKIESYFPVKQKLVLFQVRIDSRILDEMKVIKKDHDLEWRELIESCFRKLLDETKK